WRVRGFALPKHEPRRGKGLDSRSNLRGNGGCAVLAWRLGGFQDILRAGVAEGLANGWSMGEAISTLAWPCWTLSSQVRSRVSRKGNDACRPSYRMILDYTPSAADTSSSSVLKTVPAMTDK